MNHDEEADRLVLTLALCLTAALAVAETDKTYTIGIAQFAEHSSLDNCREGFIKGLAGDGAMWKVENVTFVQNAQADMGLCQQIAQQMARRSATGMRHRHAHGAGGLQRLRGQRQARDLYRVRRPVAACWPTMRASEYNVTGTCDVLPVEAQLKLRQAPSCRRQDRHSLHHQRDQFREPAQAPHQDLAGTYGRSGTSGVSTGADIPLACGTLHTWVDPP